MLAVQTRSLEESWDILYVFVINNGLVWVSRLQACYATSVKTVQHRISNSTIVRTENLVCSGFVNFFLTAFDINKKNYVLLFLSCHDFIYRRVHINFYELPNEFHLALNLLLQTIL